MPTKTPRCTVHPRHKWIYKGVGRTVRITVNTRTQSRFGDCGQTKRGEIRNV